VKHTILAALLAATLAGCATTPPPAATATAASAPGNAAALAGMREMKMAFDITSGDPQHVLLTLIVVEMTHKQLVDAGVTPRIVVGFRGDASYFTTTDLSKVKETGRADALKVMSKIRDVKKLAGVEAMEQCNIPLGARKLAGKDVMPEVQLVGNGWISLASYQTRGYSYISP
jgi:intracellular sulfur oxidation DsrE/DsrF family protein